MSQFEKYDEKLAQLEKKVDGKFMELNKHITGQGADIKRLENTLVQTQASIGELTSNMSQLIKIVGAQHKQGQYPSDTVVNPKEHCNIVELDEHEESLKDQEAKESSEEVKNIEKEEVNTIIDKKTSSPILDESFDFCFKNSFFANLDPLEQSRVVVVKQEPLKERIEVKEKTKEWEDGKEATKKRPSRPKKNANTSMKPRRATKAKDPGSFTISCSIGSHEFHNVMCDLGSSINLMSLKQYRQLGLREIKRSFTTIKLADGSSLTPLGVAEDVVVKVLNFEFPSDFLVVDMKGSDEFPFILGRPFLATSQALIDVPKGELVFRVQNEIITLNIHKSGLRGRHNCSIIYTTLAAIENPRAPNSSLSVQKTSNSGWLEEG